MVSFKQVHGGMGSVYKKVVGRLVKDNNIQVIHNIQENISLKYTYTEIKIL